MASRLDAGTQDRRGFDLDERAWDDERGNLDERRRRKITGEKRRAHTSDLFAPARVDWLTRRFAGIALPDAAETGAALLVVEDRPGARARAGQEQRGREHEEQAQEGRHGHGC